MDGGGDQKSTSTVEMPKEVKPFLTPALQDAFQLYKQPGPNYFPGPTVAGFTPEQLGAQAGTVARATSGSPLVGAASGYGQDVLSGKYLGAGNPYTDALAGRTRDMVNANYSASGRYGSGSHDRAVAEGLAPVLFQDYEAERARMDQMAGLAPTLAAEDYRDLSALNTVGAQRQGQAQTELDSLIARYNYEQNLPQMKNRDFISLLYGNPGRSQTTTQPGASGFQQALGGLFGLGGLALGVY